jgi:hypothetical protein
MPMFPLRCSSLCLALAVTVVAGSAHADSIDELRTLVGESNSPAAWSMAERMAPASAGDPEFDFWYGIAARGAGHRNEALFAFERVAVAQPENSRAKLELADLHYQFGNMTEARSLFDEVLASNPPEAVQQKVRNYLGAIDSAAQGKKSRISYTAGFAAGHDSNIGSSTDVALHDTFLGAQTLLLNSASLASDAAFVELRAAVDYVAPVSQRTMRFVSAALQRRDNEDILAGGNFDNTQLSVSGGWMLRRGNATWRIPLAVQALWAEGVRTGPAAVNDDRYLTTIGAEYSRPLSAQSSLAWFGRVGDSHYPSESSRNSWLLNVGGSYGWSAANAPLSLSAALVASAEPAQEDTAAASNSEKEYVAGLRGGLHWAVADQHTLTFAMGLQSTQYRQAPLLDPPGSPDRADRLFDLALGWQWVPQKDWTLNADITQMSNDSQRALYEFDRTQFRLGSTWRF